MLAKNRAKRLLDVIDRRGSERSCRRQLFVGVTDGKSLLVVFDDLGQGITRVGPRTKTRHVHGEDITIRFAFDHPLGQGEPHTAALAETRHHAAGGPVIAQTRNRTDERVTVRGEGKGTVNDGLDPCRFQYRKTLVSERDRVADLVEVIRQQFMTKIPGRTINCPGLAGLLVKPDTKAPALLAKVTLAAGIHDVRVLRVTLIDLCNIIGDDILMFHGMQRQIDPRHGTDFSCPKTPGIDDMLRDEHALIGHDFPTAIASGRGLLNHRVKFDLCTTQTRRFGIGVRGTGRIKVAIKRII